MSVSQIIRWFPLVSVGVLFTIGLVLGFFYPLEHEAGKQWTLEFIDGQSKSKEFHLFGSLGLLWYAICVAVAGRSTWPVSNIRNIIVYWPMAFAYGFAARFFIMIFGFTIPVSANPSSAKLALLALVAFSYLSMLVAIPTYATFIGKFTSDERLVRIISVILSIVLCVWLWLTYSA